MFIRNFFGLLIIFLTVIFVSSFNNPLAYAQAKQEEIDGVMETEKTDVFTDRSSVWLSLPPWTPEVDGSSTNFMVKLKLLTYPSSVFIKYFAVKGDDSPSIESTENSLGSVTFYFSPTEGSREIRFMVSVPADLSFEFSDLRLEFYSEKDGVPAKISGQVFPIVLLKP